MSSAKDEEYVIYDVDTYDTDTDRAYIEINLDNLEHNVKVLKAAMPAQCELMAVLKSEAYGHGADVISAHLEKCGVHAFAVSTIDEGIRLRKYGVRGDILILGYTGVRRVGELKEYDLTQTLIGFEYAEALNRQGVSVKVHIKIDTGMHRLGIEASMTEDVRKVFAMKNLQVCGMFTHLCCADSRLAEDIAFTRSQISCFYHLVDTLKENGIRIPRLHIQSSYGFWNYPEVQCDYVRAGAALYGVKNVPGDDTELELDLRPVLSLKSKVVLIRSVKCGDSVGYGRSFKAKHDSRIAILPVGYGDGFPRSLSDGKGSVLIGRHKVPVVGRVCMNQLIVDITDAKEVGIDDTAILIGATEYEELTAPAVAQKSGSFSPALLCGMGRRLPVIPVYGS